LGQLALDHWKQAVAPSTSRTRWAVRK
jgi:hypothetical protein